MRTAIFAITGLVLVIVACASSSSPTPTPLGGDKPATDGGGGAVGDSAVPASRAPNFVFVIADNQRHDSVACMPKLKQLMGQGVEMANSFASTPLCCPGRTSVLTGRYAHNHGVRTNGDDEEGDEASTPGARDFLQNGNEELTFAKWLQGAGYRTGFYGKYLNGYEVLLGDQNAANDVPKYWSNWHAYSKPTFFQFQLVEQDDGGPAERVCYASTKLPANAAACKLGATRTVDDGKENYATDILAEKAASFVTKAAGEGKPFFLYFAPKAPHGPYQSPERYQPAPNKAEFTSLAMERLGNCPLFEWTQKPASYLMADTAAMPQWVKQQVGKRTEATLAETRKMQLVSVLANEDALETILRAVEQSGQKDNTIVLYTADNGYSWGEHHWDRKNCAYDHCSKVPLLAFDPRSPRGGATEQGMVMNVDLAPTFAELAGVPVPAGTKINGTSIAKLITGKQETPWPRSRVLTECWGQANGPDIHAAARTVEWKYIEHYDDDAMKVLKIRGGGKPEIELYDLVKDPSETQNLGVLGDAAIQTLGYTRLAIDAKIAELKSELVAAKAE